MNRVLTLDADQLRPGDVVLHAGVELYRVASVRRDRYRLDVLTDDGYLVKLHDTDDLQVLRAVVAA